MGGKLLTEREVAEQLGMSVHWMRRKRIEGGGIPFIKMGDGKRAGVRYEQSAVDAFKDSRARKSTSDGGKR